MNRSSYGPKEEAAAAAEAARALAFIEAHLFEDVTATRIAQSCAVSEFHFSRRFSRRHGESVMSYVRGRRLDIAASRLLREPKTAVVEIALDSRFESQAAFTRAFTRAFGISPIKYRRSANGGIRKRRTTMTSQPVLHESIEHVDTFYVAGLTGHYDPSSIIRINELWTAFVPLMNFEGRLGGGETCGVFRERNLQAQSFEHLAGARIATGNKPRGLEVWTLPSRIYLVFKQMLTEGELYPQVNAAQLEIWGTRIAQLGNKLAGRTLAKAPDFQIYPANFKVGDGGWLAYYIPIE